MSRSELHSALYFGRVRHRRFAPATHAFRFPLMMAYLDLSELDEVFRGRWLWSVGRRNLAWFRRRDYLDPETPDLDTAVRDRVRRETGRAPTGPVRMLSHLRMFGHCFNPLTVYYCFRPDGETLDAVVTAITNTPWGERHAYVLDAEKATHRHGWHDHHFDKAFHVSPFMPMDLQYRWCFRPPGRRVNVHMDVMRAGRKIFDATLGLHRRPLTGPAMAWAMARYPAMSLQVVSAIHWQALRLWLKRVPFHPHPDKRQDAAR